MGKDDEFRLWRHSRRLFLRGARPNAVYIISKGRIDFPRGHGTVMRLTFVYKISIMLFLLPQDHGILRRHLDQHEPLACPLPDHDLLAQAFLRDLDLKIVRSTDRRR